MKKKFTVELEVSLDQNHNKYGIGMEAQVETDMRKAILDSLFKVNEKQFGPFLIQDVSIKDTTKTIPLPTNPQRSESVPNPVGVVNAA